ncbi:DNA gyrase inhibitor YacG [Roseicella sp. DB1501]|uniref:DNA gyrase inhibitor YacG n=1 Tax=Roseicella sp. DB1501 TaxID=2730925 RepID=UPI001490CBDC|nr:DNA gyrase inhibitor YacG [Roseicella sp. DB1501]NOG71698.1 DNA gyrase inhibitor YacG [Roseicella sp. DB1501]
MAESAAPPQRPARPYPRPCPVCSKPVAPDQRFRPFCSARCRQIDLGRWLAGDYAIPGEPPESGPDEGE